VVISLIAIPSLYAGLRLYDASWTPTGLKDPQLIAVVGENWAVTSDGQVFHSSGTSQWFYIEWGDWKRVDYRNQQVIAWGPAEGGLDNLVVLTPDGLWYGWPPVFLGAPPNTEPIDSVGGALTCHDYFDVPYAISAHQLALYDRMSKNWVLKVLSHGIVGTPAPFRCRLYFIDHGGLRFLQINSNNIGTSLNLDLTEDSSNLGSPEVIRQVASNGGYLWVETTSGRVIEESPLHITGQLDIELPRPPALSNMRLVGGTMGSTLWGAGDQGIYQFDPTTGVWNSVPLPSGSHPEIPNSVSISTWSSELAGGGWVRLAIAKDRLYRQRDMGNVPLLWTLSCAGPATLAIALLLAALWPGLVAIMDKTFSVRSSSN
jgi:hypothetical protein